MTRVMAGPIKNAMSVDVEDYFQVSAFAPHIRREDWDSLPCRVERNVDAILGLLDELASHGYGHQRVSDLTPAAFRDDITRAKRLLEDLGGVAIRGYRAPSFSINQHNWWAVEELENAGYVYSSSIYPVKHDHYGMPDAPRFANRPNGEAGILELPPTTLPLMGRNLPAAGGGWFRLLPYELSRWMLRRVNTQDQAPCMFYFHPWELDAGQPRQHGISAKTRFRHYINLQRMPGRLRQLLNDFEWDRVDRVFLAEK